MSGLSVSAFYKFTQLPDPAGLRAPLLKAAQDRSVRGTILLAPEGINGTLAGEPASLASMLSYIRSIPDFTDLESKESYADTMPFRRMKVRLKKEIVKMGVADVDPSRLVGTYVPAEDWNALISRPDVLVLDTRNSFEFAAGTFAGATDPQTRSFGEFPAYVERELSSDKQRPLALFCTGGIRCEKATSFLKARGFEKVYHLKGGILKYLETIAPEQSMWNGQCFVFDEREGLGHGLSIKKPKTP